MKNHHFIKGILVLFCLWGMSSCNDENEPVAVDPVPEKLQTSSVVMPNGTAVVNIMAGSTINGTPTLTTAPQYGEATLHDSGLLEYRQTVATSESSDRIAFNICEGSNCLEGTVSFTIVSDSAGLPCGFFAMPDYAEVATGQDPTTDPVFVDLLANDVFCSAQPDSLGVELVTMPKHGSAEIFAGLATYRRDDTQIAASSDEFIYKVSSTDGLLESYALVHINLMPDSLITCDALPVAEDDYFQIIDDVEDDEDISLSLPVLSNDFICDPNLLSVHIVSAPDIGTLTVHQSEGYIHLLLDREFGQEGNQYIFEYALLQGGDRSTIAQVVVAFGEDEQECELDAEDDVFYFTWSDQASVVMDVLDNDEICSQVTISITEAPVYGTISIDETAMLVNYHFPDTDQAFSEDHFNYQLTDANGNMEEATVRIVLDSTDWYCQLVAVADDYSLSADSLQAAGGTVFLPIATNDVVCESAAIQLERMPEFGAVEFGDNPSGVWFILPQGSTIQEDSFSYYLLDENGNHSNVTEVEVEWNE